MAYEPGGQVGGAGLAVGRERGRAVGVRHILWPAAAGAAALCADPAPGGPALLHGPGHADNLHRRAPRAQQQGAAADQLAAGALAIFPLALNPRSGADGLGGTVWLFLEAMVTYSLRILPQGALAPVAASAALFGAYLLVKWLPDLNLQTLFDAYFWLVGAVAVASGIAQPLRRTVRPRK